MKMAGEEISIKIESNDEILPGYPTIENFTKEGYKILMEAIKNSNSLPNGRDYNFYDTHDSFTKIVKGQGDTILKQINSILRNDNIDGSIFNRALEEKTELMIEANDVILDRVANNLDELNGIRKTNVEPVLIQTVSAQIPVNGSWNRVNNATFSVSSSITSEPFKKNANAIRLLTAKNILRPQKFFKDKVINSSKYPWEPRIKEKPNSLKPLAIFLEETQNGEEYSHPYEFELEKFIPSEDQLKQVTPIQPCKLEDTPLIEIDKPELLNDLVETLRNCKEFAVDLEHHSYRSFMGITCLMQISTSEKDYLIDTLALRNDLHILNEVFTKPSIVKIFHGSDMDVQWLQRDLSIYVVNMFDTYQAAKQLGYSGLSLSYLMQRFCNFMPNKHFQLADWRIRPLPEELKVYAREDTHYLIYIYQMLKNELLKRANGQNNLLLSVINNSTTICKKRYFKPVLREDSHLDFYRKCKRLFDNRQMYALRELYRWRDQISREEDESTGYVLPNHMLLQISETLPREMQGILACCNPIPPLVRANLLELHQIILKAKEQPLEKPIMKEDTRARGITLKISKINVDSPLNCPHDLTKSNEFRDDLPTLIGGDTKNLMDLLDQELKIESVQAEFSVFNSLQDICEQKAELKNISSIRFLGPFERYKMVKPYIQAEEERLSAESAKKNEEQKALTSGETSGSENRTDEERIELIREHFLSLARQSVPVVQHIQMAQSLVEMGGTKKRKREPSPQDMPDSSSAASVQTTVPNLNRDTVNNRKRKSSDLPDLCSPSKLPRSEEQSNTPIKNKRKSRTRNRWKKYQNPQNQDVRNQHNHTNEVIPENQNTSNEEYNSFQVDTSPGNVTKTRRNFKGKNINKRNNRQGGNQQGGNPQHGNQQGGNPQHGNQQMRNQQSDNQPRRNQQGGNQQNRKQRTKFQRQDEDFAAYDYSSVDFRQFEGGAGVVQTHRQFKSSFKFKGKKKNNKANNRSATFGNGGKKV